MQILELRRLLLLHALASHGTIAAAARSMQVTGPAVSQQLAVLEREVGMPLVQRHGRRLRLTRAGEVLVSHAEVLLGQLTTAEADLAALRGEVTGTVRLAAFSTMLRTIVPLTWQAVHSQHRDRLRLIVLEMEPEESLSALRDGELDLAIMHAYDSFPMNFPASYERHELMHDPIELALPADDPLLIEVPPTKPIDLTLLADRPWISSRQGTSCHQMMQRACGSAGFVPNTVAFCSDFATQLTMVACNGAAALVPRLAVATHPSNIALRKTTASSFREVFAVTRSGGDRHPAVRIARNLLTDACAAWSG
jgi:DNA-binding transcriptional LysR family regulator